MKIVSAKIVLFVGSKPPLPALREGIKSYHWDSEDRVRLRLPDPPDLIVVLSKDCLQSAITDAKIYAKELGVPFVIAISTVSDIVENGAKSGYDLRHVFFDAENIELPEIELDDKPKKKKNIVGDIAETLRSAATDQGFIHPITDDQAQVLINIVKFDKKADVSIEQVRNFIKQEFRNISQRKTKQISIPTEEIKTQAQIPQSINEVFNKLFILTEKVLDLTIENKDLKEQITKKTMEIETIKNKINDIVASLVALK